MLYTSTRDNTLSVTSAHAISVGISEQGGLFVPKQLPKISAEFVESLVGADYITRAERVLSLFLTDFSRDELSMCVNGAYKKGKFSSDKVAPLVPLTQNASVLELFKGPTCAFKDMALQLLPYLLTVSSQKSVPGKTIVILVATSGDTGKAALEGFKDVENTKILVFYPSDGVSPMQKLQMSTQQGENVGVCAIKGNFDDAQNGVKRIFTDKAVVEKLARSNMMFSSANSINWGRLAPQIVYYISAYADLIEQGKIKNGDPINVVVPTGNFGNILAAYYAKKMGLKINKLICASNSNNVLTDFLKTGTYDKNRRFYTTVSPSMDILISSNLERLLFDLTDGSSEKVSGWMRQLAQSGKYTVDEQVLSRLREHFAAGFCTDEQTRQTISEVYKSGYLCDTHTAVAIKVYNDYVKQTGDNTHSVIASTASAYKFPACVLSAVTGESGGEDEFEQIERLASVTGVACPPQLSSLREKPVRFSACCQKEQMEQEVYKMLGIE